MKNARLLMKKAGISVLFAIFLLGLLHSLLQLLQVRLWMLCMKTTPEGYLSNANLRSSLLRSPWILPAGLLLLIPFIFLALWEVYTVVLGIGYAYQGQHVRSRELLIVSFRYLLRDFRPSNFSIALFALVLLPLTNVFQATNWISAFVIPEYIKDFIYAKTWLEIPYLLFILVIVLFVVRRMYMLPAFILKDCPQRQAVQESIYLFKAPSEKRGISLFLYRVIENIQRALTFSLYQLLETVRLSLLPYTLLILACAGCYYVTRENPLSQSLIVDIGLSFGKSMISSVVGSLIYISIFCLLISDYLRRAEAAGLDISFSLPQLKKPLRKHSSLVFTEVWCSLLITVIASTAYFAVLFLASNNSDLMNLISAKSPIIAHKGYSSQAPENTMAAFALADTCANADMIELDVWSTKDGIPVVIHNASIKDATGRAGYVYNYTYEELQQFPAVYGMDAKKFGSERIPALEDVLAAYAATTPILIEIKGYQQDNTLAEKIVALMDKYDVKYTSMIHSGDRQALQAVKEIDPGIQCGLIMALVTGDCYDLPYADFFSVEHTFITEGMLYQIHLRGKKIFAWTVNYDTSAHNMQLLNVDAIITDYPDEIADFNISISEYLAKLLDTTSGIDDFNEGAY